MYREREREKITIHICVYIYIYVYIERERYIYVDVLGVQARSFPGSRLRERQAGSRVGFAWCFHAWDLSNPQMSL